MVKPFFRSLVTVSVWQVMLTIGRGFFVVAEWNLLMKEFWWNCFLNDSLLCYFVMEGWILLMTIFLLSLWQRGFSQWLPGKMCLGRVYVCFILIFFEERSLIHFFIPAEFFGFISWGILSISMMFFFFNSTDKIYRSLILW